jgi:hydrogenase small subunit
MENRSESNLMQALARRGVSRRDFLKFCTFMAGTLALPVSMVPKIAKALEAAERPVAVWLEFQDCAADTEAFLRASHPDVATIILELISLDYHETIMTAAGHRAEELLAKTVEERPGQYLTIVEGSIPTKENGVYCCIGGRTAVDIVREVAGNSAGVIAVGACASWGGWPSSRPDPTGASGVSDVVSGVPIIKLTGCPHNVVNSVATIVYYLTYGSLPDTDHVGRPLFAYGKRIHDNCERRGHFDAGQYVEAWGDEGHRDGWCLYKMGCKGPGTYMNCPTVRYNEGTSWPIGAGHGCVGCAEVGFWDNMSPFYRRLPEVPGFGVEVTADRVGLALTGLTLAGIGVHAVASTIRGRSKEKKAEAGKAPGEATGTEEEAAEKEE